jgi:acyl-CoA synthetase (NDP forming)
LVHRQHTIDIRRDVTRDLNGLFNPRSVAVVGASKNPHKWGYHLAQNLLAGESQRRVFLVNNKETALFDRPVYATLGDLPDTPEMVVIAVPETVLEETVSDALDLGAKVIVAITAGFGEVNEAGAERERRITERVRAAGAALIGPNCLGVFDAAASLSVNAWGEDPVGTVGLVSQSGNVTGEIALRLEEAGLGFSRYVGFGNQADVTAAELLPYFTADDSTSVIALYLEDLKDGRQLARAAEQALEVGKPVLLLTAGESEAGRRAVRSHTGALASESRVAAAACRAAGILQVSTPSELAAVCQAFILEHLPRGRRVGIVGDGGGFGAIASDLLARQGADIPVISAATAAQIAEILPPTAAVQNPIDFAGGGEADFTLFERVPRIILTSGDVDAVLMTAYFGGYSQHSAEFAERETEAARKLALTVSRCGRPLIVHTPYPNSPPAQALRNGRVPVYSDIAAAVTAIRKLIEYTERREKKDRIPDAQTSTEPRVKISLRTREPDEIYSAGRAVVESVGINVAEARAVTSLAEGVDAAEEIGFPVVLKALGIAHKSDTGGVALAITDPDHFRAAFTSMDARVHSPSYAVEAMVPSEGGLEIIVGARRDRAFGPIVLAGLGGIYTEILDDTVIGLAPIAQSAARELLLRLRAAPLLLGSRRQSPLDVDAIAFAMTQLGDVICTYPEIDDIEINPLLVRRAGAMALDARIIFADTSLNDNQAPATKPFITA